MSTQITKSSARLALSTGSVYFGVPFGAVGRSIIASGELVFNTAMVGYQESLTDPSYLGQILIQTQPMIGNTGTNPEDTESPKVQVAGFGVHEYTPNPSNYRSSSSLDAYLSKAGVLGIAGLDTRAITRVLRSHPSIQAILTDRTDLTDAQLVVMARKIEPMAGQNLAASAGTDQSRDWSQNLGQWGPNEESSQSRPRCLVLDFGIKSNIARHLSAAGCEVEIVPHTITAEQIKARYLANEIQGVFLSNGPGDPDAVENTISMLKALIADQDCEQLPINGICLGHQLLALALGASTYKLPFGHRGANHPVHDLQNHRIQITSQNHGFVVDRDSIEQVGGVITHVHLNDSTVAGFKHATRPIVSVQFHPESSPGPHDSALFFREFVDRIKQHLTDSCKR